MIFLWKILFSSVFFLGSVFSSTPNFYFSDQVNLTLQNSESFTILYSIYRPVHLELIYDSQSVLQKGKGTLNPE